MSDDLSGDDPSGDDPSGDDPSGDAPGTVTEPADDRSSWLSHEAYLAAFASDADRLAALARGLAPDVPVPTCPGWTVLDLVRHCTGVYAHKVAVLRLGRRPEMGEWDLGEDVADADAVEQHDVVRRELVERLSALGPDAAAWTWMEGAGEGTTGAWARRMAHEALVHRVDAEAAAGEPLRPAVPGLAVDGIHEVLTWMAGDPDVVADPASGAGAAGTLLLDWGARAGSADQPSAWRVELPDGGHVVRPGRSGEAADAVLRGDPFSLDLHLWGRLASLPPGLLGDLDAVEPSGDPAVLERLAARLRVATQ